MHRTKSLAYPKTTFWGQNHTLPRNLIVHIFLTLPWRVKGEFQNFGK